MAGQGDDSDDEAARRERNRRGFANAGGMTFGLLKAEVLAVDGGWCEARMLDGDFAGWLCPHVHATAQEAEACPEKESLLKYPETVDQTRTPARRN